MNSPADAHAEFEQAVNEFGFGPAAGLGDEAAVGTVCDPSGEVCGPAGAVRVSNAVIELSLANIDASLTDLLQTGVSRLCPKCKFPTS